MLLEMSGSVIRKILDTMMSTAALGAGCLAVIPGPAISQPAEPDRSAQWVTLGTAGGPILHGEAAQISNALRVGKDIYLFDVGNSVLRQMDSAHMPTRDIKAVFISHHHPDHNADLGLVILTNWLFGDNRRPALPIIGARGTVSLTEGLAKANATTAIASFNPTGPARAEISKTVEPKDVPADLHSPREIYRDNNIRVLAIEVEHFRMAPPHMSPYKPSSLAFRIEAPGRIIAYTGDTGMTPNIAKIARGADTLVSEVSLDKPEDMEAAFRERMRGEPEEAIQKRLLNNRINHLTPEDIGRAAADAGVAHVVLTHYTASPNATQISRAISEVNKHFKGTVQLAHDLERF